jgi:RND family efflux transporter MFP subunit
MVKRRVVYAGLFGVVLVASYFVFFGNGEVLPTYESVTVKRGVVEHSVSVTGHVEPVSRIALAFNAGGRITNILLTEDALVEKGEVIAELDGGVERSTLTEAEARVERERAVLSDLLAPLRVEEKALKDASVINAEQALTRSEDSARATIARAYILTDSAIHEKVDELFSQSEGAKKLGTSFTYDTTKFILQTRPEVETVLNTQRNHITTILENMSLRKDDTTSDVNQALTETEKDLIYVETFLTQLAEVVNKYDSDTVKTQTVYESFQASVAAARTAINTARTEVVGARSAYSVAVSTLSLALRDLELSVAGASDEAVLAQEAMVKSAEAAVQTVEERVKDTVLRAPFAGMLTRIDKEVGGIVAPYEPVAELMVDGVYEVEAYIPEADIARIKIGDSADITFDAFDRNDVFTAEVVRIALTETFKEGVPAYKTTLRLLNGVHKDVILRPGMTADIEIHTDAREDVLFVPVRSVLREGERTYVRILDGTSFVEKDIETGLRGSEGTIEVLKGLSENEEIVLYVEEA